ncbi:uncharacterized protein TM35_001331000 [Trypanosoma theileri]|uniref:Uncharacterized protein n=1 Tax=Trypanosoma theileri TaxID=67003 RepID=A0A1X0NFC7_9TRYP|nr:uncharacterized protein TM35_001331000 [Trypanosoma theileri]ORC81013.1 hypothetical protein TM35_001331000 [Trypanosoma theileri]
MIKTVMVRCYLLCLLTLALCCACGLVWADSPKASDALIKTSTIGVPSLVRRAIPAQEDENWLLHEDEDEDGDKQMLPGYMGLNVLLVPLKWSQSSSRFLLRQVLLILVPIWDQIDQVF